MPRAQESRVVKNTLETEVNAYQRDMPMHTVGTRLGHTNVAEAVKAAGLDWNVNLRPMFIKNGDKEVVVPGRRAVVRDTDDRILATVGGAYHALQNMDAFQILQPAIDKFGVTIDAAGVIGKGDRVWMSAKLPDSIEPVSGDRLDGYFLIITGHNGWTPFTGRLMPVRFACLNQLPSNKKTIVKLRHGHTTKEQILEVTRLVTQLAGTFKDMGVSFKRLASVKVRQRDMTDYFNKVLGITGETTPVLERRHAKLLELAATGAGAREFAPGTAWSALNAVTEYVDHVRPAEVKAARTLRQANESALFGANARLKLRAYALAQELAK